MNMLSEVIEKEKLENKDIKKFEYMDYTHLKEILEEKKREFEREKIIEENKDDPVSAAKKTANIILKEAQEKLKDAEIQAGLILREKEKELREKLEKEYREKLENELNTLKQKYIKSIEELIFVKESVYIKTEKQLMNLIMGIAKKIIGDEIKTRPDVVINMLKKGFEKIKDSDFYEIRINPYDYEYIANNKGKIKEILNRKNVRFIEDETIEKGGCKIITNSGEISSEPGEQLDVILEELKDEV